MRNLLMEVCLCKENCLSYLSLHLLFYLNLSPVINSECKSNRLSPLSFDPLSSEVDYEGDEFKKYSDDITIQCPSDI
ncbi:hypothetical protein GCM10008935_08030 [Alkalibacillus silvisoli]|uniref:Uncharacterized protein n=1 Tax=Alkalibacillus silvisoli TaxID=392823 RepID=A0ABN0ZQK1_9BACI